MTRHKRRSGRVRLQAVVRQFKTAKVAGIVTSEEASSAVGLTPASFRNVENGWRRLTPEGRRRLEDWLKSRLLASGRSPAPAPRRPGGRRMAPFNQAVFDQVGALAPGEARQFERPAESRDNVWAYRMAKRVGKRWGEAFTARARGQVLHVICHAASVAPPTSDAPPTVVGTAKDEIDLDEMDLEGIALRLSRVIVGMVHRWVTKRPTNG